MVFEWNGEMWYRGVEWSRSKTMVTNEMGEVIGGEKTSEWARSDQIGA